MTILKKYSLNQLREQWNYNEIDTVVVGNPIYEFEEVSSTMNVVKSEFSTTSGGVVVSCRQTKGIGRFDREWHSDDEKDLLFSYILNIPIEQLHTMLFINSISLLRTVSDMVDNSVFIKWPNDIYCNQEKIAGILTKTELISDRALVIVGIGLNVNSDEDFFLSKKLKATSLKSLTGKTYNKRRILYNFLNKLNKIFAQQLNDDDVFKEWKDSLNLIGETINFSFMTNQKIVLNAIVEDIDSIGRLKIRNSSGKESFLSSEEITIVNEK